MKLKRLIILFLFIPFILNAQSIKRTIKMGDNAFKEQDYFTASDYYKQAYEISPIEEATYNWALSEFYKRDYKLSLNLFKQVAEKNLEKYPLSTYYMAMNQKSLGRYQLSNRSFHKFYKEHRRKRDYFSLKAKQEILSTEKAFDMSLEMDSLELYLEDRISDENFSELLFRAHAANKNYLIAKRPVNDQDTLFTSRLFLLNKDSITALDTNVNNAFFNISGFCFTKNENQMLVSACYYVDDKQNCKIYQTTKENGDWSSLEALPNEVNSEGAKTIHPYFFSYQNKEFLIFASDHNEGQGGFDLYFSEYKNGKYKKAKNLGRRVNSIDNEISPIYDTLQEKLFFSSEWFYNNGGYDIFYSNGKFPDIDVPENMGQPINSNYDDLFYSVSYDYKKAYLSSNRKSGALAQTESCCNDIYSYNLSEFQKDTIQDTLFFAKKIEEMEKLIPIDLYFDNDQPNPKTRDTVTQYSYEETYDKYFAKVKEYEDRFSEGLKKEGKFNAINMIDDFFYGKVEEGFDKLKEFNIEMIKLLREGYEIELTVKGFASPLNSNSYNIALSKRRVRSIVKYYQTVEEGLFINYIDSKKGGGRLTIIEEAFGEDRSSGSVSDDRLDARNSIYSPWAAEERRVQLVAFKLENKPVKKKETENQQENENPTQQ